MNKMNYTKGEWKVEPRQDANCIRIKSHDPNAGYRDCIRQIADVFGTHGEDEANAQLIASAPYTYETLRTIVEALHANEIARACRVAESNGIEALAKAEGK